MELYEELLVALLSTFEIYAAIGTGMAFALNTHVILVCTLVGGLVGTFVAAFLGDKIKAWFQSIRKKPAPVVEKTPSLRTKILNQLWSKYGIFGIGFIGTFLVGAPISLGVGIGFGLQSKQMLPYAVAAVITRSFVFTYFFNFIKELF
jgi:hypothetical protein